jgi:hypothetical protein
VPLIIFRIVRANSNDVKLQQRLLFMLRVYFSQFSVKKNNRSHMQDLVKLKVKLPLYRLRGLRMVEAHRIFRQSHVKMKMVLTIHTVRFYPLGKIPGPNFR